MEFITRHSVLLYGRPSHPLPFRSRTFGLPGFIIAALAIFFAGELPQPTSGLSQECIDHCDQYRPLGLREDYELDCTKISGSSVDCRRKCSACPSICNPATNANIFQCPSAPVDSMCMDECDKKRRQSSLDGYVHVCTSVYLNQDDLLKCRQGCSHCPKWVCDYATNPNRFHCPTGSLSSVCSRNCEDNRQRLGHGPQEEFSFSCYASVDTQKQLKCKQECSSCPKSVCDPSLDDSSYFCPPQGSPIPWRAPTTTTTMAPVPSPPSSSPVLTSAIETYSELQTPRNGSEGEYVGACEKRCEKHRSAGPNKFTMVCSDIYQGNPDYEECFEDCRSCPLDVCDPTTGTFQCPAVDVDYIMIGFIAAAILAFVMSALAGIATCALYVMWKRVKKEREKDAPKPDANEILIRSPPPSMPVITTTSSDPTSSPDPSTLQSEEDSKRDLMNTLSVKRVSVYDPLALLKDKDHRRHSHNPSSHHHRHSIHSKHH